MSNETPPTPPGTPPSSRNTHDSFFRNSLSRKEIAADFLTSYLPAQVLQHIDLETLVICKESFVDARQKAQYSDVLYQVSFKGSAGDAGCEEGVSGAGGDGAGTGGTRSEEGTSGASGNASGDTGNTSGSASGYVYVLFEHKSYPDNFTSLQLLRYMVEIWQLYRKQHRNAKQLPLIIPVVVYHGQPKGKAVCLKDLVLVPDERLHVYVPNFAINFYDFSPKSEETIRGQMLLQAMLYCLKATYHGQAEGIIVEIFRCITPLDESDYIMKLLTEIYNYLFQVVDVTPEALQDIIQKTLSGNKRGEAMTLAQRLEEKGRKEGRAEGEARGEARGRTEGRTEGRLTTLLRLITRKFGEHAITRFVQDRLNSATIDQLDHWCDRILDAGSVGEVFATDH